MIILGLRSRQNRWDQGLDGGRGSALCNPEGHTRKGQRTSLFFAAIVAMAMDKNGRCRARSRMVAKGMASPGHEVGSAILVNLGHRGGVDEICVDGEGIAGTLECNFEDFLVVNFWRSCMERERESGRDSMYVFV